MERYKILEKEINKGLKIDEKVNEEIKGWSPNNVKRIIIGVDYIVVEYFITGGKYRKLREVLKIEGLVEREREGLARGDKVEKILKVLTARRILSGIEEIVFCAKDYPKEMLRYDMDISVLGKEEQLKNRYVRLESIGIYRGSVREVLERVDKVGRGVLIKEVTQGDYKEILSVVKGGRKGTNLRGRWYSMDKEGGELYKYFQKEKESKEREERESRLKKLDEKKYSELLRGELSPTLSLMGAVTQEYESMVKRGENLGILERLEWGDELKEKVLGNRIRCYMKDKKLRDEDLIKRIRRVDMEKIECLSEQVGGVETIKRFKEVLWGKIQGEEESYKRESNKLDVEGSIECLNIALQGVLKVLHDTILLVLGRYVNRGGEKGREMYRAKLGVGEIRYSRVTIERLNKNKVKKEKIEELQLIGELVDEKELGGIQGRIKLIKEVIKNI